VRRDRRSDSARPAEEAGVVAPRTGQPGAVVEQSAAAGSSGDVAGVHQEDLVDDFDDLARDRWLSALVFWAPALILLLLAGVVIWLVR
jgi:hypothetical protein